MEQVDTVVIGAGVVGLAVARSMARAGGDVVVLEAEARFGEHLSSRNSEVIHGGLYYPPGSLKADTCLRGNALLYQYCAARGIAHRRCGKLVVAGPGQQPQLQALYDNALAAGARDLSFKSAAWLGREEPWLSGAQALHSTHSGIVDSHALMASLARDAEDAGAVLCLRHRVSAIGCESHRFTLRVTHAEGEFDLRAQTLINAAGLAAVPLVKRMQGFPRRYCPEQRFAKGNYFRLAGASPSRRLIYPLPEAHGLGVHLTVDLAGKARFGPDVQWVETPDYQVDEQRQGAFETAIRRYWPALPAAKLHPDYAGVRPKLIIDDQPHTDFLIQDSRHHGVAGLINLLGIESPGLTAALALAERITEQT
ncbi:NAD(P)/FAD-dependent oxidoreductase [Alloalcanivorax mobilis]|uniref:NAD(P)/FAD-dependent oxidoreductase n=1 Tax=Alloalcanivorax mobilis TaxID=2019569 RepID=UPI000C75F60C|nr:NAD(P)/FAD-dependent oxidoreductase [Alloalcanivorax mobilis]